MRPMNKSLNVWYFYVFQILRNAVFFLPVIVLFWQDNGLSMTQIMLLQSLYAFTIVILEIPTGYFADIVGRKHSLVLASCFYLVGMLIYSVGEGFFIFLAAELMLAFTSALISGSDVALLFDTLRESNSEEQFKRIWGHSLFLGILGIAVANVLGGFIGAVNMRWTFFAAVPFAIGMLIIAALIREPRRHKLVIQKGYISELLHVVRSSLITNRRLRWLIIYAGIVYAFNQAALWLYQPYFQISGVDIFYFGLIFASFQIFAAVTAKYAYQLERLLGKRYSLWSLILLTGTSYLLMSNFIFLFSFSFAFLHQFVRGFSKVVIADYVNQLSSSDSRATALSVKNQVGQVFYALLLPMVGYIVDAYSLVDALLSLGIVSLGVGIVVLVPVLLHRRHTSTAA